MTFWALLFFGYFLWLFFAYLDPMIIELNISIKRSFRKEAGYILVCQLAISVIEKKNYVFESNS